MAPLEVTTVAGSREEGHLDGLGTVARFRSPHGLTFDSAGNLIVCDYGNKCIRKVHANGAVTTLAGLPQTIVAGLPWWLATAGADGVGAAARFEGPYGVTADKFVESRALLAASALAASHHRRDAALPLRDRGYKR